MISSTVEDQSPAAGSDILPYVVPMFAYVGLSGLENYLPQVEGQPSPFWYPLAYTAKHRHRHLSLPGGIARPGVTSGPLRRSEPSAWRPPPACSCGRLWIGLDGRYPMFSFLGSRAGFNADGLAPAGRWAFISVRLLGLVLVVPADRRAVLAIVLDAVADRPRLLQGRRSAGSLRWPRV